ncbi:ABC transporter substrate-binding protein [Rhodococcoides kyotonense]|uniref:Iron complex transport system substrate-binding protein n=1 Tax=Rhodococcoides kyotonense TaxID=398843 RepID=A0A239N8C7_9NOCA|nr:iron-siderophore ABC transporter substrate-binding protein [Rhodococcus kyotonensis]SNT50990.1 iron complex transport system substrate-binding protein [Rhodococcus kyotonensis]
MRIRVAVTSTTIGLLALSMAACSSSAEQNDAGSSSVTIEHIYGSTTIEETPQRVVTLGVSDADAAIALGTVPVGNTGYSFYETGLGPWTDDAVGDSPLTLIESDSEPNLEQIAELAPDLIIGINAGFDEAVYGKLSEIAPTIARPADTAAYTVSRVKATETIATALGVPERGDELNRETAELLDKTKAEHPEFAGRTGVAVLPYDGQYGAFLPGDARGQFLNSLGLSIPDAITSQDTGESFFVPVSAENIGMLDADVILFLGTDENIDVVAEHPLFGTLPAAQEDNIIATSIDQRGAITYNSVLSIPYAIDTLVP